MGFPELEDKRAEGHTFELWTESKKTNERNRMMRESLKMTVVEAVTESLPQVGCSPLPFVNAPARGRCRQ